MAEVYASHEVTAELLSPISGAVLHTVTFQQDITASERPVYVERGYARSGAMSSRQLRSRGSISLRKSPESFALVQEIKRWQKGVTVYNLTSDLKGKTYRHPNLRLTFTNVDGTVERVMAYGIRLSDRTLSVPQGGLVGDAYTMDVLGGFDVSESEAAENYEPRRALDFARTGPKTYISTAGTLSTATDGAAAIGLPYVVRRNIITASDDWTSAYASQEIPTITRSLNYGTHKLNNGSQIKLTQLVCTNGSKLRRAYLNLTGSGVTYRVSFYARKTAGSGSTATLSLADSATQQVTFTSDVQRFELTFSSGPSWSILNGFLDFVFSDLTIEIGGLHVDPGSVTSPYQATNASGVDLTNPINGAGLVLEGASTNILSDNQATAGDTLGTTDGFSIGDGWYLGGTGGISVDTGAFQGSKSIKFQGSGGPEGVCTTGVSAEANSTYTAQLRFKGEAGKQYSFFVSDNTNGIRQIQAGFTATGDWEFRSIKVTTGGNPVTSLLCGIRVDTAGAIARIDALKIEKSPFPTSWHTGTRFPDLCGIPLGPHNLLPYSEFQAGFSAPWTYGHFYNTSFPAWVQAPTGGPSGQSAAQVAISGGNGYSPTAIRPITLKASTVYTISAKVRTTSATGVIRIALDSNGDGGTYNPGQQALPANNWVRVSVTLSTDSNTAQNLKLLAVGGGTLTVTELQITEGFHPGIYVRTTDTPIPAPTSPTLDPAWQQNTLLTGYFVQPSGAAVAAGTVILGYVGGLLITQLASTITLSRVTAGGTRTVTITLNAADNARHSFSASCGNYVTSAGVRAMPLTLTVDSTTATIDAAALYGDTAWSTLDAGRLVSGGTVNATLSYVRPDWPTIPAGSIPAV